MKPDEWLDAGQCRDCFIPSFNYRPGGSTQYALAISNFDDPSGPQRFHFGLLASSDNHQARPGTGYKEFGRKQGMTEAGGARDEAWRKRINPWIYAEEAVPESREVPLNDLSRGFATLEAERQASFFLTGGLAAVHTEGRSREQIWDALRRKEVYGTSGDQILLWFHLLNAENPDGTLAAVPMGGEARMTGTPRFEVRAVGAFEQKPGCPEATTDALSAERIEQLCRGECFNPSDERKQITRIEVVRIRPQVRSGRALRGLIDDPWKKIACDPSPNGCVVQFEDPDFATAGRDTALLRARHRGAEPGRERGRAALPHRRDRALHRGESVPGRLPHAARTTIASRRSRSAPGRRRSSSTAAEPAGGAPRMGAVLTTRIVPSVAPSELRPAQVAREFRRLIQRRARSCGPRAKPGAVRRSCSPAATRRSTRSSSSIRAST